MKLQVQKSEKMYEIELLSLTQLCGTDLLKKNYMLNSLRKHFSAERYMEHEGEMIQNVYLEGDKVGRKYFHTYYLKEREDFIGGIKLAKTSLMMQYVSDRIRDFQYQEYMEGISGNLQNVFLSLNQEIFDVIGNLEFHFEEKDLFSFVQSADICGVEEQSLEKLENWELIQIYINILLEIHKKRPEKTLMILENIDHLLAPEEYDKLCIWIEEIGKQYDIWFLISTSISGYVYLSEESMHGINIVNDDIFNMPFYEKVFLFLQNNYPCTFSAEKWTEELKMIVHYIGKENFELYPKGMVFLKLINKSMCIDTIGKTGLNQIESSFLLT